MVRVRLLSFKRYVRVRFRHGVRVRVKGVITSVPVGGVSGRLFAMSAGLSGL